MLVFFPIQSLRRRSGGKRPRLPAGSACISQTRSFHQSGGGKCSRWEGTSSQEFTLNLEQLTLSRGCNLKEFKIPFIELQTYVKHMDIFTHLINTDLLKSVTVRT